MNQKPVWQSDAFIILFLVLFFPVGLILMWMYSSWKKWAKVLITIFFTIGALPIIFIWTLLFGIQGYSFINNTINPRTVDESALYNCQPMNAEWGRCTNSKYGFSFEYPAHWHYVDLRPEGIGFSPQAENIVDNFVISLGSPGEWDTEEDARDFALDPGFLNNKETITINGLTAGKDYSGFDDGIFAIVTIVDGNTTYQFRATPDKAKKLNVSMDELEAIFTQMTNSFEKE